MARTLDTLQFVIDYKLRELPRELRRGDKQTVKDFMDFFREPDENTALYLAGDSARCAITHQGSYGNLEIAFAYGNYQMRREFLDKLGIRAAPDNKTPYPLRIGKCQFNVVDISNIGDNADAIVERISLHPTTQPWFSRRSNVDIYITSEKTIPPVLTLLPAIDGNPGVMALMDSEE